MTDLRRNPDLDLADAEYARSLQNDPSLVDAWRMRSRIALEQKRDADAIKLLVQGLEYNPEQDVLAADILNLHLLRRDTTAARPLMERLLRVDAEKAEYIFSQARLLWMEGDYEKALDAFRKAVDKNPLERRFAMPLVKSLVSLDHIPEALTLLERWQSGEANGDMFALLALLRYDLAGLDTALHIVTDGLARGARHPYLTYLNAALLTLAGDAAKAKRAVAAVLDDESIEPRWRGFLFARKQRGDKLFCGEESSLLTRSLQAAPATGAVLEFGVYHGLSLRKIARHVGGPVHGFDSFEGLPEDWKPGEPRGSYSTAGRIPAMPAHVKLHRGWFQDTLPKFVATEKEKLRFVHVDCDLYSSTKTVLEGLRSLLQPGTVFLFDEYLGFDGFEQHEYRAWHEFAEQHKIKYEYIGFTLMAKQVALRVTAL